MGEVTTEAIDACVPAPAQPFEVLGRLLMALRRETELDELLQDVDFWSGLGQLRGGYVLEWRRGPYADELYRELVRQPAEINSRVLSPADFVLRTRTMTDVPCSRLSLWIRGVPVELRSCDPVGLEQAELDWIARSREDMKQLLTLLRDRADSPSC